MITSSTKKALEEAKNQDHSLATVVEEKVLFYADLPSGIELCKGLVAKLRLIADAIEKDCKATESARVALQKKRLTAAQEKRIIESPFPQKVSI